MPKATESARGGVIKTRTIRVGKGKKKRYLRVSVVRKAGPKGGHTVASEPHRYKGK